MVVRIEIDLIDDDDVEYVIRLVTILLEQTKKGFIFDGIGDEYP